MSSILTLQQRREAFISLGRYLLSPDEQLLHLINTAHFYNGWFTPAETLRAVTAYGNMLNPADLSLWMTEAETEPEAVKTVGLVLAGNIPAVGFHDILSVLAAGHTALIKLSSQDNKLLPAILEKLTAIEPAFKNRIVFTERLTGFDAVLATGSDNTSRYFEYYFSKVPHIIRKNRNSLAVITGKESTGDLKKLGHDIFDYFGLGCRNVSKILVPEGYNFASLFEAIESFKNVQDNHKYHNNYDYNKSILLVNGTPHLDNGFLLLKKDNSLFSPLAVLNYQAYYSFAEVEHALNAESDSIQCVVTNADLNIAPAKIAFGESQKPRLWDYADGVNTLQFLRSL